MKRLILFIFVLCLTACVRNEDFNKTCVYSTKSEHIDDVTSINVTYDNKDKVKEAIVTKSYKSLDDDGNDIISEIKEASLGYNQKYGDTGIKVTVSKDSLSEYEIKYYLDVQNTDDDILEEFKLKKNSIRFFNKMRSLSVDCEGK